jgi:hypothetical protein
MINVAFITYANDVTESIRGFHEIEFTSQHVVFRMSETDRNRIIAVRADLIFELITHVEEE